MYLFLSRRTIELERLNKELEKENLSVNIFPCNVASSANVDQTVKKILAEGKIDCLINNAGITSFKSAVDNSTNEIDDIINTNLLGSIYTIKYVLPHMIEQGKRNNYKCVISCGKKNIYSKQCLYCCKNGLTWLYKCFARRSS